MMGFMMISKRTWFGISVLDGEMSHLVMIKS